MTNDQGPFFRTLRADVAQRDHFRRFLVQLRDQQHWPSKSATARDPRVIEACAGSSLSPNMFWRTLERTIKTGKSSPANLRRFARVFGFRDASEMISDFARWSRGQSGNHVEPIRDARFEQVGDDYVLLANTRLIGQHGSYLIHSRITDGAATRGDSYKARVEDSGEFVFIKTLSLRRNLIGPPLDRYIKRSEMIFEREQWSLAKMDNAQVPHVSRLKDYGLIELHVEQARPRLVRFIVQEFIAGSTLPKHFCPAPGDARGEFTGVSSGRDWMDMARQLLEILRDIHALGVSHGDIRPDNVMRADADGKLFLVDFGQGALLTPTDADESSFDAPHDPATDLFDLGRLLYWLATGDDAPEIATPARRKSDDTQTSLELRNMELRDRIASVILSKNKHLADYNEGIIHLISGLLHHYPSERLGEAADVLRTLDLFETLAGHDFVRRSTDLVSEFRAVTEARQRQPQLFGDMIDHQLRYLLRRAVEMFNVGRVEVTGTRDQIITSLLAYLAILGVGDSYVTTTTIDYWTEDNLGIRGRFLTANQMVALRGVRVRRLFVVRRTDLDDPKRRQLLQNVLRAQNEIVTHLHERKIQTNDKTLDGSGYYCGVLEVGSRDGEQQRDEARESLGGRAGGRVGGRTGADEDQDYERFIQGGAHIGFIRAGEQNISLSFQEDRKKLVRKIFLWKVDAPLLLSQRLADIARGLARSKSIPEYLRKHGWLPRTGARRAPG